MGTFCWSVLAERFFAGLVGVALESTPPETIVRRYVAQLVVLNFWRVETCSSRSL
jgi:hypothetical protein